MLKRLHSLRPFGSGPLRLEWELRTQAGREEVWGCYGDTEAWNRALGVEVEYRLETGSDGTVRAIGTTKMGGRTLEYHERRYDYEHARRTFVDRRFERGPFTAYTVAVELDDLPEGGTLARYTLEFSVRHAVERPLAALGLRLDLQPRIDRVIGAVQRGLRGEGGFVEAPAPSLPADADLRLVERIGQLTNPGVRERLVQFVRTAPESTQDRMQARMLAREWELPEGDVVNGFIEAVAAGVLEMQWELLCPSCAGPAAQRSRLDPEQLEAHCGSCNIRYDAVFADSVGVTFRPVSDIRPFDLPIVCVGSPARTPHVLARAHLYGDDWTEWNLDLTPGAYQVREMGSLEGCHLEVRAGASSEPVVASLGPDGRLEPRRLRRGPGPLQILIRSRLERPARLVLERAFRPRGTLTAGMLLERPGARELLPAACLPPDLDVSIRSAGVLAGQIFDPSDAQREAISELIRELEPTTFEMGSRELVATWPQLDDALRGAARLEGAWQVCSALGFGPLLQVRSAGGRRAAGSAVDAAIASLRTSIPGRTAVSEALGRAGEVERLVKAEEITLEPGPELAGRRNFLIRFLAEPPARRLEPARGVRPSDDGLTGLVLEGRYRLGEQLGRGGFGTVYAAEKVGSEGPRIGVKIMRGELMVDPAQVGAFFREARIGSRLDHPNVVRFLDFGHGEQWHIYLVMELLAGRSLQDLLDREMLTPRDVALLSAAALSGLEAMHEAGLIHRDIKPDNIFLCEGSDLAAGTRLLDFGIAVEAAALARGEESERATGTLAYMSPEQLSALPHDGRADLYSLGISMWQMLASELPFWDAEDQLAGAIRRMREGVPDVRTRAPDVPEELAAIIARAVSGPPSERFEDAAAMRQGLEAFLAADAAPPE